MTKKPDIQSFEIHTMDIKITENGYIFEKDLRSKRLLIFLISFSIVWYLGTWNIYGGETPQFKSINYEILRHIFVFIVSLSSSYFTLVIAFNKHKLVINEKYTQTKCVPLPWFSNYKINRSRIGKFMWKNISGFI